jgi:hypothetical protein
MEGLRRLLWEWDPIGVSDVAPDDEYDCLIPPLLDRLRRGADPDAPTPCPACGAGADQASDPEHMSRAVCYCGHPRYYDDKHRDGTCPCQNPAP